MTHTTTQHDDTTPRAQDPAADAAEMPTFFLTYDDPECADWLATDPAGPQALALPPVMARLCALGDALFLHTVLRLALPAKAGLGLFFTPQVLARMAAVPQATYDTLFLPCARRHLGFAADAYWDRVQASQRQDSPPEDAAPEGGDAASLSPGSAMATLAAIADDEQFCEEFLDWVRANAHCRVNPMPLEDAAVIARLCTLPDHRFTPTLIALAKPDCLGLDILYDDRLLPRLARMRRGHLRGTFLPYARQLQGFLEGDFLRELRQTQREQKAHAGAHGTPVVISMDTVMRTPVTWLWWPYLAIGKLTMVDGDPGIGKSLLMTQIAAALSKSYPLPDQDGKTTFATGGPHVTVMLSTEDGLADTLKPRLEDAGADCSKVKVLTHWDDANGERHPFTFFDMPILEKVLEDYHPRLVIIDPIQAYLGGIDINRANETRPLLAALHQLAEQYQCAIACIRHPAKAHQGGKALHRGLGSVDFIGAARTGLFVEQHPLHETKVLVAQSKSNIGPLGRTLIFSKEGGQFEWCGRSRLSAEMLAGSGRGPDPAAFLEAVLWLERRLEDGLPVASTALREDAEEEGVSFPTLRRAKKALRVESHKPQEEWYWQLPGLRTIPQPTPLVSLASLEPLEHVQPHQAVSGETIVTTDDAGPVPCGCGHAHAPGDCTPEVIENMEDVQETQETQEGEETEALEEPPPAFTPPMFCPSCHRQVTWINRGTYFQCGRYHCPGKVLVR
jgi:hypothetical protein